MSDATINDLQKRMDGAFSVFEKDLSGLRTGRASPNLLEAVQVEVYGSMMPLNQVATISVPEARMLSVQVWDQSNAASVEKAISSAGLGLNPAADGALIRVPLPDLSEERRQELCKVASKYAENTRVSVRNIRRDGMDKVKKSEKDGEISQDEQHQIGDRIQKLTDEVIKKIDETLAAKEKDIMEV